MDTELSVSRIFPTSIFSCFHPNYKELNKKLLKYIYEIESEGNDITKSNIGGFHSDLILHLDKRFDELGQFIIHTCNTFIHNDISCKSYADSNYTAKGIGGMWFNINRYKDYNTKHIHPETWFSGAYYIKTPDSESNYLEFEDPVKERIFSDNFCKDMYRMPIKEGMLVLFPAWFVHGVPQNQSNEDRISISFNVEKPTANS